MTLVTSSITGGPFHGTPDNEAGTLSGAGGKWTRRLTAHLAEVPIATTAGCVNARDTFMILAPSAGAPSGMSKADSDASPAAVLFLDLPRVRTV